MCFRFKVITFVWIANFNSFIFQETTKLWEQENVFVSNKLTKLSVSFLEIFNTRTHSSTHTLKHTHAHSKFPDCVMSHRGRGSVKVLLFTSNEEGKISNKLFVPRWMPSLISISMF